MRRKEHKKEYKKKHKRAKNDTKIGLNSYITKGVWKDLIDRIFLF
jgi:hypothetical protein